MLQIFKFCIVDNFEASTCIHVTITVSKWITNKLMTAICHLLVLEKSLSFVL